MKTIKLDLSAAEKQQLKQRGLKVSRLNEYAVDEIGILLNAGQQRAKEICALIAFQSIPSIGPKFAHDLISLGYYSIDDLLGKVRGLFRMHQAWTVDVRWRCRLNIGNDHVDFGVLRERQIVAEPDLAVFDDAFNR